ALAQKIAKTQREEITEMKRLLKKVADQ
ncbi:DUF305 domain-containing protein, partial [Levilactobacillus brevis]|nr:DUF305 domain-containing protein [Levilactobacillus brevis]MCT3579984.1 DUF305 domain-containing protein [Levilactobacillus brevis]